MLYNICNNRGELKEGQISDADPKLTNVTETEFLTADGETIPGFVLEFDGKIHNAVAGEPAAPATPDEDTDDEIHLPSDVSSD